MGISIHKRLLVCIWLLGLPVIDAGWFEKAFDFSTPILSTLDVGSDVCVSYNFWRTAREEGEKPVFFLISFCLLLLSSLCGVVFFLFSNWSVDKDDQDKENDQEDNEEVEAESAGILSWFPRFQLSIRLDEMVQRCGVSNEKHFAIKMLLTSVLILALLPLGQLLPLLLWLQAKKDHEKKALVPPVYPAATQPKLRRLGFGERHTATEVSQYDRQYVIWYYTEFLPYIDASNKYFDCQLQRKIKTHLPFVVETGVEAIPQSLLQTSAITIFSQRDPRAITLMNFVSIALSLASIFSKAYIACSSLLQEMFIFKMLLLCCDISSLFYSVSALWSLRREDSGGVHVFFLTRPVDIASAIYVWCLFVFACVLFLFVLLRALGEWVCMDIEFRHCHGEDNQTETRSISHKLYLNYRGAFFPGHVTYNDESVKKEKQFTTIILVVISIVTSCFFCLTIVPIIIFVQTCKLFWISLWLKNQEQEVQCYGWTGPFLLTIDEVVGLNGAFSSGLVTREHKHNALLALSSDMELHVIPEIAAQSGEKIRDEASFEKLGPDDIRIIRLRNATVGYRAGAFCVGELPITPQMLYNMGVARDRRKVLAEGMDDVEQGDLIWVELGLSSLSHKFLFQDIADNEDRNKTFFVQAYAWVMEGADFNMRACAVNHSLLTQHHSQVLSEPLQPNQLRLGICRFWIEFVQGIPEAIRGLTVPYLFSEFCGELFEMFRSYEHITFDLLNASKRDDAQAVRTWHSTKIFTVIMRLGYAIQHALIITIMLSSAYMVVFPFLSFALALCGAVSRNRCSEMVHMADQLHNLSMSPITWSAALEKFLVIFHKVIPAVRSLYIDDCYPQDATPLNLFRTALIFGHLLLLLVLFAYWLWKARYLLSFTVAVEKVNVEHDPEELMKKVRNLYEKYYKKTPCSWWCDGGSVKGTNYQDLPVEETDAHDETLEAAPPEEVGVP